MNQYTGIEKWLDQLGHNVQLIIKGSERMLKDVADQFLTTVMERTPIGDPNLWKTPAHKDYEPGTLRKSWVQEEITNGYRISNSTIYAYRIEFGAWSIQAPAGMMRVTIRDVPQMIAIAKKREGL